MIEFIYNNKNSLYSLFYGIFLAVLGAIGISFHPLLAAVIVSSALVYTYNKTFLEDENIAFIALGYFFGLISYSFLMPTAFLFSFDNYLIRIFLQTLFISILIEEKYDRKFKYAVGLCLSFVCPISLCSLIAGVFQGIMGASMFGLGVITYILSFLFNYFCIIKELPH